MQHPKPRPPAKRLGSSKRSPPPAFASLPLSDAPTTSALQHKLSSSSLSMSQPPDSPPTTYDSPAFVRHTAFIRSVDLDSDLSSPATRTSNTSYFGPNHLSVTESSPSDPAATATVPFPSAPPFTALRARTLSAGTVQDCAGAGDGQPLEPPPLDSEWLQTKTRSELEELLTEADRVIRERTRDLETAANVGKYLLEENNTLRNRHDSLVSRSPTKVTSDCSSSLAWRNSLGVSRPPSHVRQRDSDVEWEDESSPTTPLQLRGRPRHSSTASLFAPTPRVSATSASPAPPQVQSLNQANWALTLQLTELEADSERAERAGKKKLKKLEREIAMLRTELERVEQRNDHLEDERDASHSSGTEPRPPRPPSPASSHSRQSSASSQAASEQGDVTPTARSAPRFTVRSTPLASSTHAKFSPDLNGSPITPTHSVRRTPGNGASFIRCRSPKGHKSPDEKQDEIVSQLFAKIDELQQTNTAIEGEREEMVARLGHAQSELDEFKKRCDDLEGLVDAKTHIDWESRKGAIGWHGDASSTEVSPVRLKGNQRMISERKRHSGPLLVVSPSDGSISSFAGSLSRSSSRSPSHSTSRHHNRRRSLGSELGRRWEEQGNDANDENEDEEEDDRSTATASTSVPFRYQSSHSTMDGGNALVTPGSLRYSVPDSEEYEQLASAAAALPAEWEDDNFGASPPRPTRGLLKSLKWHVEEDEDFMDDSHYPEDVSFSSEHQLESADAVAQSEADEQDGARRRWGKIRRRRYARSLSSGHLSSSRRDAALRRLGLSTDARRADRDDGADSESDSSDMSSNYDYLQSGDYTRRGADYYPLALRARYHPRMVATRAADSALQNAVLFLTYVRFFLVLAFAVAFALWQGPKKSLGLVDGRRRLH